MCGSDPGAGQTSLALQARAFLVGSHVVFAPGVSSGNGGRPAPAQLMNSLTVQQRNPGSSALSIQRATYQLHRQAGGEHGQPADRSDRRSGQRHDVPGRPRHSPAMSQGGLFSAFEAKTRLQPAQSERHRSRRSGTDWIPTRSGAINRTRGAWGDVHAVVVSMHRHAWAHTTPLFNIHLCMNNWPGASGFAVTNLVHQGAHPFDHQIGDSGYFDYHTCGETASTGEPWGRWAAGHAGCVLVLRALRHDTTAESRRGPNLARQNSCGYSRSGGPIDLNGTTDEKRRCSVFQACTSTAASSSGG